MAEKQSDIDFGNQAYARGKDKVDALLRRYKQKNGLTHLQDTNGLQRLLASRLEAGFDENSIFGDLGNTSEVGNYFTDQATKEFAPAQSLISSKFGALQSRNAQDFGDTETRLRDEAQRNEQGTIDKFSNLGLLQSGATAAGIGKVRSGLSTDINRNSINRAIADADLALQEAGAMTQNAQGMTTRAGQLRDNARVDTNDQFNRQLQQSNFDFSKIKSGSDLLMAPEFNDLLLDSPDLARQLLQQFGFRF